MNATNPYLQALPALPYEISHWENSRAVNIDFHVIYKKNRYSTHQEDMPPAFRKIVPWDDTRIRKWAAAIGLNISEVIERIFRSVQIKEQAYLEPKII